MGGKRDKLLGEIKRKMSNKLAARRCRQRKAKEIENLRKELEEAKKKKEELKRVNEELTVIAGCAKVDLEVLKMETLQANGFSPEEFTIEVVEDVIYVVQKYTV